MKKLILYSVIGLALILIKDNPILAAAKSTAENIEFKEELNRELWVINYINNLNELLNSVDSPEKEQRIKEKLNAFIIEYRISNSKKIIQFFKDNRERLLKFIDGKFLSKLIFYRRLELFEIFLSRDNVNLATDQTLLMAAIPLYMSEIEFILKAGADVNQIILDRDSGETALGKLIYEEVWTRNLYADFPILLNKKLKDIAEIAKMLFHAGADINLGGKIKKDYWGNYLNIQNDTDLVDLKDNPACKIVFEEYEKYQEYKKSFSKKMMEVQEIAMFPPGLLPICVSYLYK